MEKEMNQEPRKEKSQERKKGELILTGEVVSTKNDKTITVSVPRNFQHPVYGKIVTRRKKYLAHDETNRCKPGDAVRIKLVRPISKRKRWLLLEVVSTAPEKETPMDNDISEVEVPQ